MNKSIILFLIAFGLLMPPIISAQGLSGPLIACGGAGQDCTLCDLFKLGQTIFDYIMIAIFIIAPVFLIAGGVMILISGLKPDQLETGKNMITYTIIGIAIALLSWTIVNSTLNMIAGTAGEEAKPGGFPWPWNRIECTGGGVVESSNSFTSAGGGVAGGGGAD